MAAYILPEPSVFRIFQKVDLNRLIVCRKGLFPLRWDSTCVLQTGTIRLADQTSPLLPSYPFETTVVPQLPINSQARLFFNAAMESMLLVSHDGRWIDANSAACKFLGRNREELLGKHLGDFLLPDLGRLPDWQQLQRAAPGQLFCFPGQAGQIRVAELRVVPDFLPDGDLLILCDRTHQVQVEGRLEALQQEFQAQIERRTAELKALTDELQVEVQHWQAQQVVLQAQAQQERVLNTALEQQVLERTAELQQALEFEALLKRITDKVRDSLDEEQILQTVVQELGEGLEIECCDTAIYDLERRRSTICHELVIHAAIQPAKGSSLSFDCQPAIYGQLLQGNYLQFCPMTEPCLDLRWSQGEYFTILSCPLMDDQRVLGDIWLFKPGSAWFNDLEIRLVRQVANQCAIALRQSRLYQAAQTQVKELERLNHLKDDFLSTVSHELRTPVSNIRMAVTMLEMLLLQRKPGAPELDAPSVIPPDVPMERVSRYLQILQDECQREIALINDLLDLARLDSRAEPLVLSTVNPRVWLTYLAEPFIERSRNQQQHLEIALPDHLPALTTDLSSLERILSELLNNACKYTPSGETITLSAQMQRYPGAAVRSASLQVAVTNTGVEIPPSERDRIFEKFYRIPKHDPWKHGGTGLGLALIQKLAERLGARIHVESYDDMTSFILTLPATMTG